MPTVSIVIPVWNGEPFVRQAIDSALGQTYPAEVIVIDDGSTDGSLEIIRSYGPRIRLETGPNQGGSAARNLGVRMAHGDYIQFLDADDVLSSTKLERQMPRVMSQPADLIYCDYEFFAEDGAATKNQPSPPETADPVLLVLRHTFLQTSSPIHRKEQLNEVGGFRVGLKACQEFDLHLRLAVAALKRGASFVRLPETLWRRRQRAESVSGDTGRTLALVETFLPEIVQSLGVNLTPEYRAAFALFASQTGQVLTRHERFPEGVRLIQFADTLDRAAVAKSYGRLMSPLRQVLGTPTVERIGLFRRQLRLRLTRSRQ